MKNLGKNWPAIRQVAYSVLAALLALGVALNVITEDQSTQWLSIATSILGALGLLVANLFVDRTSPAQEAKIEQAVEVGLERAAQRVQPHVQAGTDRVNDLREQYVDPFIRR